MKRFLYTSLAAVALLAPPALGADKKAASFGALEPPTVEAARDQAAAWLKALGKTDAATQARFEEIWKREGSTILERVAATFELGSPEAARLLAQARDQAAPAPTAVPALLKDTKAPIFFRANLGLAYARALAHRRVYEEALDVLKLFQPEQVVDPAAYLFHRAVSEHALLLKADATRTIERIIDDAPFSPERYKTVSMLMLLDMHTWKEKDLRAIARKMENVERRLELARGGPQTQKLQKEIVLRLDELIKELENKNKNDSECNSGNCPNGGKPSEGGPRSNNPTSPATQSGIVNQGGTGMIDQAKLKKLMENWGSLPPRERTQALQELTQGMSQRHREAIENYFRNLANTQTRR
ncbi:MAG: hypothetical protein NZO58_02950 [Gemmataceae bacterium]|nr:hypothetical protein [Gemmataceae bacterium]